MESSELFERPSQYDSGVANSAIGLAVVCIFVALLLSLWFLMLWDGRSLRPARLKEFATLATRGSSWQLLVWTLLIRSKLPQSQHL